MTDERTGHLSHRNVTLLTAESEAQLDALLRQPEVRALVWKRLDGTRALVDSERVQILLRRLRTAGAPASFSARVPRGAA